MLDSENVITHLNNLRQFVDVDVHPVVSPENWDIYATLCDYIDQIREEVGTLLKEQEAKQPIYIHEEFQEHDWYRNKNGKIDEFAFDAGYHNGPSCKRCCYSFCIHCDPNGWNKKPCVIDEYRCPRCKKYIIKGIRFCSYCGQAVKWDG